VTQTPDGPQALAAIGPVSRETLDRFDAFVRLLRQWQSVKNLVGPATLHEVWHRHIADSLQLIRYGPLHRRWVDIGSGAGFPGLVMAIAMRDPLLSPQGTGHVHLIEPNARKAAFLQEASRVTGTATTVHAKRFEEVLPTLPADVAVVTARAVTRLAGLCGMVAPLVDKGAVALFLKGQDVDLELTEATRYWKIIVERWPSITQAGAAVLRISSLRRVPPAQGDHIA
jgi:16S rRNA (guanine527-N7)-methyltransferase